MAPARPYRFPATNECEPTPARFSTAQSCGTCSASAVANCLAVCCCPCAAVTCFTLALVKAPYVAGRRWARLANRRRVRGLRRKPKRVQDLDDQDDVPGGDAGRVSKEWGELSRAAASWPNEAAGEGRMRVSTPEKVWMELYEVGHWGFGRLSFSVNTATTTQVIRGDNDKDGNVAGGQG